MAAAGSRNGCSGPKAAKRKSAVLGYFRPDGDRYEDRRRFPVFNDRISKRDRNGKNTKIPCMPEWAGARMKIPSFFLGVVSAVIAAGFLIFGAGNGSPAAARPSDPVEGVSPAAAPTPERAASKAKAPRPEIVSRREWNAAEPVGEGKEHTIRRITIHHTATAQKADVPIEKKLQGLQRFSQTESRLASGKTKPVWFDVPYHYYIAADGRIAEGRDIRFAGDTNTAYDPTGHALVVIEGNFETEHPTSVQLKSMEALVAWLAAQYGVPASEIKAHDDYADTACPGANLKKLLPALREKVAETGKPQK